MQNKLTTNREKTMSIEKKLKQLISEQKKQSFINPDSVLDSEALGIMISQYFKWDGKQIFLTSYNAFEDSNFHSLNEKFEKLWDIEECSNNYEAKIEAIKQQ